MAPPNPLTPWHDFAILLGTAAATLIGLLFVAASVGTSVFTWERQGALRVFLSPSVVHFCTILAASLITVAPIPTAFILGVLITASGLLGAVYVALVWRTMIRDGYIKSLDLTDRLWYASAPALGYATLIAAGITMALGLTPACIIYAVALALLLVAGIRNAWDITTWIILKTGA
jgi:hypothetical protein